MYDKFLEVIHDTIQQHVPMSRKRRKPQLPKEIKDILKAKRKLYHKSKTDKSFKAAYKVQEKLYKKAMVKYRYSQEEKFLKNNSKKALYSYVNKKLKTSHHIPPLKKSDGNICLESKEKADLLNDTFSSIFLKDSTSGKTPILTQTNPHIKSTDFPTIEHSDILSAIKQLKNSVSQTPDLLPAMFIKKTAQHLIKPLYIIFNLSVKTGEIPAKWKKAVVIPIYKKGKINDPANYRPISLTSVICRVLEKIIHKHMMLHLLDNRIVSEAQHGFVYMRSTQTQQLQFLNCVTSLYDINKQIEIVYLDFSKAFDKVSHSNLVTALHHYKFNTLIIRWIKNYLSHRTQTTFVDNTYSNYTSVPSGVPQGSVVGPLLFVIYLEDLIRKIQLNCKNTTVYAFADDIKLLSTDPQDLQKALDIVNTWTTKWKLLLNTSKSEHITIRNKQQTSLTIGNQIIPKVNKVRDLGLTLSADLKWSHYTHKVRAKANIVSHLILRSFTSNNIQLLSNLFKTYVRPLTEYNTSSWSPYYKSDIFEIETVQRKFTRRVCQRANLPFSNYEERLEKLNLESLETRRTKRDVTLLYKIVNNLIDVDINDFFQMSSLGGHNLRRHQLHIQRQPKTNTLTQQNFFTHRVIKYWNQLPEEIVMSQNLASFKNKLNKFSLRT